MPCNVPPPGWHCTRDEDHEGPCAAWPIAKTIEDFKALKAEMKRLRFLCSVENEEICQLLGKELDYPWFKDDQKNFPGSTEEHGVCVGDNVAATMAMQAARKIAELKAEIQALHEQTAGEDI